MDINTVTKDTITVKFDNSNVNWNPNPTYNKAFVRATIQQALDLYRARGHFFVNELLDLLGIDRLCVGQLLGWHTEDRDTGFVDFALMADGVLIKIYPGNIIWDRIEAKP